MPGQVIIVPDFLNQTLVWFSNIFLRILMAAKGLGVRPEDMAGKHWRQIGTPGEIMEKVKECVKCAINTKQVTIINFSFRNLRTNKTVYRESTLKGICSYCRGGFLQI